MARVTARQLDDFDAWLRDYGRAESTARLYVHNVRAAYRAGGPLKRLNDPLLAPKTRRHILAALRAWARSRSDDQLLEKLGKLRLPPAERSTEKVPLPRAAWLALIKHLDTASRPRPPIRAALGLMATRGFRRGDVLRMEREKIVAALDSGTLTYNAKGNRWLQFSVLPTYRRHLQTLASYDHWHHVRDLVSPRAADVHKAAGKKLARALDGCGQQIGLAAGAIYPHRLRRTYATLYLEQLGAAPDAVVRLQQHMGWRSLATAMAYVDHARGVELDDVAVAMFEEE
jgi:integrase